jgi:TolB-like protein
MYRTRRLAVAAAALAMASPLRGQENRPVVAVLYFDNNSIGKDRADYDGLGKGIADLLITDMASNPKVRIVERERVQKVLEEQNLVKGGAIDQNTAVKLGKILGAQYMITGGFLSDGRGNVVLTSRAVNVQTSEITNPARVQEKTDDVLGMITKLSSKLNAELKLAPLTAPRTGAASPADAKSGAAQSGAPASLGKSPKPVKLDVRTALLYSKALEEQDNGHPQKAADLYRAVLSKFPEFGPAKVNYAKVSKQNAS